MSASTAKVDLVVCGAGAIGLAIGRAAAMGGLEVVIIDRCARAGTVTTARNSGVIHSGLYYPRNSLKNKFCLEGKKILTEYVKR
jgi:L-2-hydroxyglutarate oxidase LhgO